MDTPRARANVENAKKDAFGKGKNKCRLAEVGLNISAAWGAGEPEGFQTSDITPLQGVFVPSLEGLKTL